MLSADLSIASMSVLNDMASMGFSAPLGRSFNFRCRTPTGLASATLNTLSNKGWGKPCPHGPAFSISPASSRLMSAGASLPSVMISAPGVLSAVQAPDFRIKQFLKLSIISFPDRQACGHGVSAEPDYQVRMVCRQQIQCVFQVYIR